MTEREIGQLYARAARIRKPSYSMFASLPKEAKVRKNSIENFIKEVRKDLPLLKYQFRAGIYDIKVMLKLQAKNDRKFWQEIDLAKLDAAVGFAPFEYETVEQESVNSLNFVCGFFQDHSCSESSSSV